MVSGLESVLMRCRLPLTIALFTMTAVGVLLAQTKHHSGSYPQFYDLSPQDASRLNQQRAVITTVARQRYGTKSLTATKADLPVLQRLLDDRVFGVSQTYQLQCLGVAFGDVLASELPLHWVMVTDEFGTDPTLRFKKTSVNVNALTMISKRVERGEAVSLTALLSTTRQQLSNLEKDLR